MVVTIFDGLMLVLVFVFFKQKTAYEMRISDWSSDVCSSDLALLTIEETGALEALAERRKGIVGRRARERRRFVTSHAAARRRRESGGGARGIDLFARSISRRDPRLLGGLRLGRGRRGDNRRLWIISLPILRNRQEEHTSELQSLMRISYAVF